MGVTVGAARITRGRDWCSQCGDGPDDVIIIDGRPFCIECLIGRPASIADAGYEQWEINEACVLEHHFDADDCVLRLTEADRTAHDVTAGC